ncbi:MAG: helix-turn-helix transcriptional regulator [Verrucomicrobia bacterium]|nr:helix-turn-helix transcriptional regulator [Verrucomicrobiota bacterium]MBT7065629.1 helix-turn-helix transcriptional regulator [Verrucomicrobiota bacterium]MBT7699796.1 helix-turn-helix transcriptional regulator [Verrucomicrobiota bacterium]
MQKHRTGIDHRDYDPPSYALSFVIEGRGEYIDYRGNCHALKPGSIFSRIPGYPHTTRITTAPFWECYLDFGAKLVESLIAMRMIDPDSPVGFVGADQLWVEQFNRIHKRLVAASPSENGAMLVELLDLHQRIVAASGPAPESPDRVMVDEAARLLDRNFPERIDMRSICVARGWGYERFRKRFQAELGVSPGRYRIRCRLAEGARLLKGRPDLSVGAIAAELGYANAYEFSAQFKKYNGTSPLAFRKYG